MVNSAHPSWRSPQRTSSAGAGQGGGQPGPAERTCLKVGHPRTVARENRCLPSSGRPPSRGRGGPMYSKDGEDYFILDAHVALWDARPENQLNVHGKQFIDCFYDYHRNLSPESERWSYEEYLYYGGERLMKDLFEDGYVDHAIFQPAILGAFYKNGFGQTDEAFALARQHPERLTYNHAFDPRHGEAGLAQLRRD